MFPRNLGNIKKMMDQLGVKSTELDAQKVVIRLRDKELEIINPKVVKIEMQGQESYQIVGEAKEVKKEPEISEEDIKLAMEKTGKKRGVVEKVLRKMGGDLAKAILELQK